MPQSNVTIQRSAWKGYSPNFALTAFYEVRKERRNNQPVRGGAHLLLRVYHASVTHNGLA